MIKWIVVGTSVVAGFTFAAGAWVGWKTTVNLLNKIDSRRRVFYIDVANMPPDEVINFVKQHRNPSNKVVVPPT